ncbi:LysR family transcriptional regulator [Oceanobacillus sp. 1P07AA]|uniref:LysR family transcriptional regulator n=1 Tax=Oceanobacillus sp. 1P07AA TaxID=3132293 RepID=UPI0039A7209E
MELRHLVTFKTIVDKGGFKKAADELGYAQSSITAHIHDLESELEIPLFNRMGKSISLTQAGETFLPYATEIIDLYSESKDRLRNTEEPSGIVIIGASETLMIHWLPNILRGFMEEYPKVEIVLKTLRFEDVHSQLKSGEVDIAFLVELENWTQKDVWAKKIRKEELVHILPGKIERRPFAPRMLTTEYKCSWRPIMEAYMNSTTDINMKAIELPSVEAIKKSVMCNLGQSIVPRFVVEKELKEGVLVEYPSSKIKQELAIFQAMHKDKWVSKSISVFIDYLAN